MDPDVNDALKNLTRLVQVMARSPDLRERFVELSALPVAARASRILKIADDMVAAGEAVELADSFRLLAEPTIFRTAEVALHEIQGQS